VNIEDLTFGLAEGNIVPTPKFEPLVPKYLKTVDYGSWETRDLFTISTASGVALNDFSESTKICNLPGTKEFSCAFGVVYVDLDYLHFLGEIGAVSLAHELGHSTNPSDSSVIFSPIIKSEKDTDEYFVEVLHKYLKQNNEVFRGEVEAWEYGHIFADLMSVDENLYNSQMTKALTKYFVHHILGTIDDLKSLINRNLIDYDETIEYYDIWMQETLNITIRELIEKTLKHQDELIYIKDHLRPLYPDSSSNSSIKN